MNIDCLSVGILVADHGCVPIDHAPAAGELVLTDGLSLSIGGCAANAAIDLARVGVKVGVVGSVGQDVFGQFIVETLEAGGVATSSVRRLTGVGTSGTLIVNVRGQDRRFVHTMGANARFTAADIPLERVRAAKVLYVGGYLLMPALVPEELAEAFRQARRWGVTTVLDVVLPGPGDHWGATGPRAPRDGFVSSEHPTKPRRSRVSPTPARKLRVSLRGGGRHRGHHLRRRRNSVGFRDRSPARRHLSCQLRRGTPAPEMPSTRVTSRGCWPAAIRAAASPGPVPWAPVACVRSVPAGKRLHPRRAGRLSCRTRTIGRKLVNSRRWQRPPGFSRAWARAGRNSTQTLYLLELPCVITLTSHFPPLYTACSCLEVPAKHPSAEFSTAPRRVRTTLTPLHTLNLSIGRIRRCS